MREREEGVHRRRGRRGSVALRSHAFRSSWRPATQMFLSSFSMLRHRGPAGPSSTPVFVYPPRWRRRDGDLGGNQRERAKKQEGGRGWGKGRGSAHCTKCFGRGARSHATLASLFPWARFQIDVNKLRYAHALYCESSSVLGLSREWCLFIKCFFFKFLNYEQLSR